MSSEPTAIAANSTGVDIAWAGRVAHRLSSVFSQLLESLPASMRRATPLARGLGLRVPLCHRVLSGIRGSSGPTDAFGAWPGPEGLRVFLAAVQRSGLAQTPVMEACLTATGEYEQLIAQSGGSQRRLVAALQQRTSRAGASAARATGSVDVRQRLYEALSEQMGCAARAVVAVRVYTPARTGGEWGDLDATGVIGRLGFVRSTASLPCVMSYRSNIARAEENPARQVLLADFCTQPLPSLEVQEFSPQRVGVIDPGYTHHAELDLFTGPLVRRNVVAREGGVMYVNAGTQCSSPAAEVLSDFYLPAAWMERAECEAGVYREDALGPLVGDPSKRWFDRLPVPLLPLLLGRGLDRAASECYSRHVELTRRVFAEAGADPSGYIGFRIHERFPLPQMHYLLVRRAEIGAESGAGPAPEQPGAAE